MEAERWLIGCECSGMIRRALRSRGCDAWSCDLKPAEDGSQFHIRADLLTVLGEGWGGLIAHPDCTFLTVANTYIRRGCSLYTPAQAAEYVERAAAFFMNIAGAPIERICIENPIGTMSTRWRTPDQIIQPWQFGDDASKATCLWLKNLRPLRHTDVLPGGRSAIRANQTLSRQNKLGPSPTRKADRARTYPGIAAAMADQWGHQPVLQAVPA